MILECRNCPYGKEDFERRMYWYEKTVREKGIPNDIYGHLEPEDAVSEFEEFLWCDKVCGKVYWAGRCSDAYSDFSKRKNHSKQKRRNKGERDQKYKNRLKFLAENIQGHPTPVIYTDEIWIGRKGYVENPKSYYKRLYRGNHKYNRYTFYKKHANRCVRRCKGEIHSGSMYKKIFDYAYTVD